MHAGKQLFEWLERVIDHHPNGQQRVISRDEVFELFEGEQAFGECVGAAEKPPVCLGIMRPMSEHLLPHARPVPARVQSVFLRLALRVLPRRWAWHLAHPAASPVLAALRLLRQRFAQDRLGVTASSLTFTTVLALVPFFAVALAIFTAFPSFERLRVALEEWLAGNLIPASIAASVLENLAAFAGKASQLGAASLAVLAFTSLSLMLTIDHALGGIWRVPRPRPLGQRLLVYWAALTLGPLLLGGSVAITSYVVSQSGAWLDWLPEQAGVAQHARQGVLAALRALQLLLPVGGLTLLYHYVPNTTVRWRHALAGGLFAGLGLAALRAGMGLYLAQVPSYSLIYGAFFLQ